MKKYYLLLILLSPLFAMAQPPHDVVDNRPPVFLGLSLNNTITGVADYSGTKYSQTSFYIFPELHVGTQFSLNKNQNDLFFRVEATATFNRVNYTLPYNSDSNSPYTKAYKVNEFVAGVNPQLLYNFNNKSGAYFYGTVGLAAYGVTAGLNSTQVDSPVGSPASVVGTNYDLVEWLSFAATLKLGYVIDKKWDIYAGCAKTFATTDGSLTDDDIYNYDPAKTAKQIIFNLGINYTFGRK